VFNAESTAPFSPAERCPAYKVPEDIAAAVRDRQRRDNIQAAELISRGTPTVPVTTGIDGGMNPIFLAAVKSHGPGATIRTASGTIPAHVNPPAELNQSATAGLLSFASTASAPRSSVWVASAGSSGFAVNLFGTTNDDVAAARNALSVDASAPKTKPAISNPAHPAVTAAGTIRPKSEPQLANTGTATALVSKPPDALPKGRASVEPQSAPEGTTTALLGGAAPTIPAGSFDDRFGSWR
jgi:hypothetical protein